MSSVDAVLDQLRAQLRAEAVVGEAAEVVHVLLEPPERARRVVRTAAGVRPQLARRVRHEIDQRLSPDHDRHGRRLSGRRLAQFSGARCDSASTVSTTVETSRQTAAFQVAATSNDTAVPPSTTGMWRAAALR